MLTLDAVSKRFALKAGYFAAARRHVYAVREVSLRIAAGETYGLVGESGSGKTTTARLAVGMYRPDGGAITYRDRAGDLHQVDRSGAGARRELRTRLAYVFQDPARSLNPRMRVESILHRRPALHRELARPGRRARPGPGGPGGGGAGRAPPEPPPARLLRRPAPAGGHRPRPDRPARDHHLRRDRLRPRRVDPQPESWSCCSACAASWA